MTYRVAAIVTVTLVLAACGRAGPRGHDASERATTGQTSSSTTVWNTTSTAAVTTTAPPLPTSIDPPLHAAAAPPDHPTTTTTAAAGPCGRSTSSVARYQHVVWIWMENKTRDAVLGSSAAPFETALARTCASASDYRDVGRPSLPNYIGATSGSTQGISDDGPPAQHALSVDNLFRQVRRSGGTARTYAEAMPAPCALDASGRYAEKHNPATYYVGEDDRAACQADDRPLGTAQGGPLASDIDHGSLPTFAMVVPDLCNDTHDCGVNVGDNWLHTWIDRLVNSSTYAAGSTAVFVVWDEMTPMPFIAVAPTIAPGTTTSVAVDHYALLRTTEEMLGIDSYLGAAASAPSMRPMLRI